MTKTTQLRPNLLLLSLGLSCFITPAGFAVEVTIPDPGLRSAVESALGKATGDAIDSAELASLRQLQAGGRNILLLDGLEFATGLEALVLRSNQIEDLTPLQNLTALRSLEIDDNAITDLSPIADLTQLIQLFAHNNTITQLDGLENMNQLEDLILFDNQIANLEPIRNLRQLKRLNLSQNQIVALDPLRELNNLEVLFLASNKICDIHALRPHDSLQQLNLSDNRLTDVSPLADKSSLTSVDFRYNYLDETEEDLLGLLVGASGISLQANNQYPLNSYEDWLTHWALSGPNSEPEDRLSPNHLPNVILYSMGEGPGYRANGETAFIPHSPSETIVVRFQRDLLAGNLERTIEISPDLNSWDTAEVLDINVLSEPRPNIQMVEAIVEAPASTAFFRLNITAQQ